MTASEILLDVTDLRVDYDTPERRGRAVDGLDLVLRKGEALALVGESGCGKSSTALALMGLLPPGARVSGKALLMGRDLLSLSPQEFSLLRSRDLAMIYQEPATALNPVLSIGAQIREVLRLAREPKPRERVIDLLEMVALPDPARMARAYPHQLSGGQRQRAMIAMAIALRPRLLIADEPTTALDVSIQRQIMRLLTDLRRELGMSLLLVSHDLALVERWLDRAVVMHHGQAMEDLRLADGGFGRARHPYSQGLLTASLPLTPALHYRRTPLPEIRHSQTAERHDFTLVTPPPPDFPPASGAGLMEGRNIRVRYLSGLRPVDAVKGVDISLRSGETLGLVGESGSGKSSLARALSLLTPARADALSLNGADLRRARGARLRELRSQVQMVFQDPASALNPRRRIGDSLADPLRSQGVSSSEIARRVAGVLDDVGLPHRSAELFPQEFSGGQRQRLCIARAIVGRPRMVICDEAVSALDVSIQAQILNLLSQLKAEYGLSYLFISHDLGAVHYISDRIMVLRGGKVQDVFPAQDLFAPERSPYVKEMLAASS